MTENFCFPENESKQDFFFSEKTKAARIKTFRTIMEKLAKISKKSHNFVFFFPREIEEN